MEINNFILLKLYLCFKKEDVIYKMDNVIVKPFNAQQ
jgi:hypothetical protein